MNTLDHLLKKDGQPSAGQAQVSEPSFSSASLAPATPSMPQKPFLEPVPERKMTYQDMYKATNPYKPPTEEQLKAERRKRKRIATLAAIGDGISALSNLYHTTRYAPNAPQDPTASLSDRAKRRYEMIDNKRKEMDAQYRAGYLRAAQADDAIYKDDLERWRKRGVDALAQYNSEMSHYLTGQKNRDQKAYQEKVIKQGEEKLQETKRSNKANEAIRREGNAIQSRNVSSLIDDREHRRSSGGGSGRSNGEIIIPIAGGRNVVVSKPYNNPAVLNQIFSLVPEEYKNGLGRQVRQGTPITSSQMWERIGIAAKDGNKYVIDALRSISAGTSAPYNVAPDNGVDDAPAWGDGTQ